MANSLPSGTVTFLFTDIEGSTKLAQEHPGKWETLQRRHHAILQAAMDAHNGYVFQIIGDAFCVAFNTANEAIHSAIKSQTDLHAENWDDAPIKVRMGIHTGQAQIQDTGGYQGYLSMSRVQRLMSAGHGGQILISMATQELIRDELPENVSLRDMGERRLKDLIRPEHIYQLDIAGLPVGFSALKTLDKYRHNLPTQMTSFIGREKEMTEIKQALTEHRLVTLTGSGGAGKTRLSLQVAVDSLDQFPNGIWFVELAPLTDPDLIPQTILTAAEMQTQQGKSALESLTDFLREKTSLLVLDNCEHLIDACAKIADTLLNAAPDLKILASSREALGIKGEQSWRVPSLSAPDVKHLPSLEQLSQYEAVRLFIDRALLAQPHFVITNENAPAIAQICHRLDGIPLAIELAAARLRMLSAEQIAERLDDRFRLLTGGSRTALPRQQTLRALIDWSYDLLSENERILLRRLTVFSGGCTLEAVEQVCADIGQDALDLLTHLVDKSLLAIDEQPNHLRYRILETIRQYAREKLLESGESEQIRKRHLTYFLSLALEAEPNIMAAGYVKWMNRLVEDNANILVAMDWSLEVGYHEEGQQLVGALWWFWSDGGYPREGLEWSKRALTVNDGTATVLRARLLTEAGWFAYFLGMWNEAKEYCDESITIAHQLGIPESSAWPLATLGLISVFSNSDLVQAETLVQESLVLFRKTQDKFGIRNVLTYSGWVAQRQGNYELAESLFQESLNVSREASHEEGMAWALQVLGGLALEQGNYARALSFYKESLSLLQGAKTIMEAWLLSDIAIAYFQMGDYLQAKKCLEQVLLVYQEKGDRESELITLRRLGYVARLEGDYVKAGLLFTESLKKSQQTADNTDIALTLINIGRLMLAKNSPDKFSCLLGFAENIAPENLWQTTVRYFKVDTEQAIESARAMLGEETYNAAYAAGRAMKMEEAIEYALNELGK